MNEKAFRNDARAKVTGRAQYTDDLVLPGMLHAVPVHSDLPRATLISLDTSEALTQPGVVAVFTHEDIPGTQRFGQIIKDYPTLAGPEINSTGDVLALIVAETREQALSAIPSIKVAMEPLTPILDPEEALQDGANILHPIHGSNLANYHCVRRGDPSRGLLVELLQDGYFDILASDHCPFTDLDKDRFKDTPEKVPCGIPGLATLFSSVYHGLVVKGTISLDQMIRLCCSEPAKLMGIDVKAMFTMNNIIGKHEEGK